MMRMSRLAPSKRSNIFSRWLFVSSSITFGPPSVAGQADIAFSIAEYNAGVKPQGHLLWPIVRLTVLKTGLVKLLSSKSYAQNWHYLASVLMLSFLIN